MIAAICFITCPPVNPGCLCAFFSFNALPIEVIEGKVLFFMMIDQSDKLKQVGLGIKLLGC